MISLPRAHLFVAATLATSIITLLSLLPSDKVEANRRTLAIELPASSDFPSSSTAESGLDAKHTLSNSNPVVASLEKNKASELVTSDPNGASLVNQSDYQLNYQPVEQEWLPTTLVNGDTLTSIFRRLGLQDRDVYLVANAKNESSQLKYLKPGETVAVAIDENGLLEEMKYSRSRLEYYLYKRDGKGFEGERVLLEPEIVTTFEQGFIENSLFLDASRAGLSEAKIMEFANIFGWDVDFALDIRKGDHFSILYEQKYFEGEKIGDGNILAASFTNQGRTYQAVLFKENDGSVAYYSPDGKPMRKAFLRAPLDFTRISSNFNMRRKHPIHKRIKAHRGVDYAAPRGTPVYAAGNGKVMAAGYSKANGNYVFIKHGGQFITKYLHLNKRKVRKGQTVKQRQTIGTVGSTGYATGPHLHYEFLVDGVHRNPRTVKLPQAQAIASSKRAAFKTQTAPLLARLKQLGDTQLALLTPYK